MKLLSRDEYYQQRRTKAGQNKCVLCYEPQVVLGETEHWTWVAALAPYWQYHTMILPKRHIKEMNQLSDTEWSEFKNIEKAATNIYKKNEAVDEETGVILQNVLLFLQAKIKLLQ